MVSYNFFFFKQYYKSSYYGKTIFFYISLRPDGTYLAIVTTINLCKKFDLVFVCFFNEFAITNPFLHISFKSLQIYKFRLLRIFVLFLDPLTIETHCFRFGISRSYQAPGLASGTLAVPLSCFCYSDYFGDVFGVINYGSLLLLFLAVVENSFSSS